MNNKPIMIVICDFIVLSMMTLIIGLDGPQQGITGGNTPDYKISELILQIENQNQELLDAKAKLAELRRSRQLTDEEAKILDALNLNLADNLVKMESLVKQAELDESSTGQKSAEELQKELIDASRKYALLKIESDSDSSDLDYYKNKAASDAANLTATKEELAALREKSLKDAESLTTKERELLSAQGSLIETQKVLEIAQNELKENLNALNSAKAELTKTSKELTDYQDEIKKAQLDLSFANGKLSATERELAETRGQLDVSRKQVSDRDLKIADSSKQINSLQGVVKKAVGDLSTANQEIKVLKVKEQELGVAREEVATLKGTVNTNKVELDTVKTQLAKAESDLRSNVYDHYSKSVRELNLQVNDRRALMDHVGKHTYYLPEVQIGDKRYLISELLTLVDMDQTNAAFENVYELKYLANPAAGDKKQVTASSTLLSANFEPRLAMLEVTPSSENAISIINADELRERGLQDLYLFSKSALGTESCGLDTRASMDAVSNEPYMFIRNSTSRNSELKANVGDFVLTRQGALAGVVVAVENFDLNSRQEARVVLFPKDFNLEAVTTIPLVKRSSSAEKYDDFMASMKDLFGKVKSLERTQRKRN